MSEIDEREIKRRFQVISQYELSPEVAARDLERTRKRLIKQTSGQQRMWRIIMKSKMSIFAAAAVIIIAAMLSITVLHTPAYALEQTIKAYEGLLYVHIKDFKEGESELREFWVELDEQEKVKRFRVYLPAWAQPKGPFVGVWSEGKLQVLSENYNKISTERENSLDLEILNIIKECDPRSVVKELHQLEAEGKVEIKISEPALKSEPIVITAKPLSPSNGVDQMVLYVDQKTKLVTRVIFNGHQQSREFSDYNVAIDERIFLLEPTPEITETFMKNINAKLTSLDINKSTVDDVIRVLGEPWTYGFRGVKYFKKDSLPEAYSMSYPGGFIVNIYQHQVMQWGLQQVPGDETPGYIFSDSIQIGTALDDVFEKLGSPTKVVEGFGGEDNKIMYEDNTRYADMNINERKGFCFSRFDNNGKEIEVYFDDNVLYKDLSGIKGLCFYGTTSDGKRVRFSFMDNKVIAIYEYRTEPLEAI